jgi:hypothetical protein
MISTVTPSGDFASGRRRHPVLDCALVAHAHYLLEIGPASKPAAGVQACVRCATALFGDLAQADLVKLHKTSGKVTFLVYDDFEGKALLARHGLNENVNKRRGSAVGRGAV